jgi:hypothetical protein
MVRASRVRNSSAGRFPGARSAAASTRPKTIIITATSHSRPNSSSMRFSRVAPTAALGSDERSNSQAMRSSEVSTRRRPIDANPALASRRRSGAK